MDSDLEQKMDSDLEPWMVELFKNIQVEAKEELEQTYGVELLSNSIRLCCLIIGSFCDDFIEASHHDKERILKKHVDNILKAACERVIQRLMDEDEDGCNLEYLLSRACVEYAAIRKEKELVSSELWIPRVRKEHDDLMDSWYELEKQWKRLLLSLSTSRVEVHGILKMGHNELISYLLNEKVIKESRVSTSMLQKLSHLTMELQHSINQGLRQVLTVRESDIVEAARRILRIPALFPSKFFKLNYEELETSLAKRVFSQEHAIRAITSALSGPPSRKGHVRSFLFINGSNCGGEELIKALAEQLFYDEHRVIEFELAKPAEDDSNVDHNVGLSKDIKCGFRKELIDAVKKQPSSVILLRNIDEAQASVIDFVLEILRNGEIADEKGDEMVDFTKMLIIMTSNVLGNLNLRRRWECSCAFIPGKLFLKEKVEDHNRCYLSVLEDAKQHFPPELLDLIDNMIVFKLLIFSDFRAFCRLRLRKLASSIGKGRIIVYPSEAFLHIIAPRCEMQYELMEPRIKEKVAPKLLEICNLRSVKRCIVYIDALVGTYDFSFRVETDGFLTRDQEFGQFLVYICKIRKIYKKEMLWLRRINGLRKTLLYFGRSKTSGDSDSLPLEPLADSIRKLLKFEPKSLEMNGFSSSANLGRVEQPKKRTKETKDVLKRLRTRVASKHYVYSVVASAILSCTEVVADKSHPMTALLLGLTSDGKANLRRELTELLHDENNGTTDMLVQIDLSECFDYDEFFKLIYASHNGFVCPQKVGMKLGSVLLIDQVEKATVSIFSGLISLLDYRVLTHHNGTTIDLRDTVIIMVSDLGNRDFICQMFEEAHSRAENLRKGQNPYIGEEELLKQPEKKSRFRFELLNRVDEMVVFNPSVGGDQLTCFARLSMRHGPHLRRGSPMAAVTSALTLLFDECDYKQIDLGITWMLGAVELLSTWIIPVGDVNCTANRWVPDIFTWMWMVFLFLAFFMGMWMDMKFRGC